MATGANSTKQESPIWGAVKKETLFSAKQLKQHSCGETVVSGKGKWTFRARGEVGGLYRQKSPVPLGTDWSVLIQMRT